MANILEAATKEYGVPLLFTGDLYAYLSDKTKVHAWWLDIVRFTGPRKYELYTVDLNLNKVALEEEDNKKSSALKIKIKWIMTRFQHIKFKNQCISG